MANNMAIDWAAESSAGGWSSPLPQQMLQAMQAQYAAAIRAADLLALARSLPPLYGHLIIGGDRMTEQRSHWLHWQPLLLQDLHARQFPLLPIHWPAERLDSMYDQAAEMLLYALGIPPEFSRPGRTPPVAVSQLRRA